MRASYLILQSLQLRKQYSCVVVGRHSGLERNFSLVSALSFDIEPHLSDLINNILDSIIFLGVDWANLISRKDLNTYLLLKSNIFLGECVNLDLQSFVFVLSLHSEAVGAHSVLHQSILKSQE